MGKPKYANDQDRISRNVAVGVDGCWNWQRYVTAYGYGLTTIHARGRRVSVHAHRVSYQAFVGPIPDGLQLDHLCRNRRCVNPAHLEPVTCQVNLLRGETRAAANAAKTRCPQGHEYTPENLRPKRYGRSCRQCHIDYMADYNRRPEVRAAKRARRRAA